MTRKDYELIASSIKDDLDNFKTLNVHADYHVELLIRGIANALAKDNPRFDSKRFLTACGIK